MDAPSKFFFGLEKKNGQSRFIHALRSAKGQELKEPGEIKKRAVELYCELFESEYREDEDLFNSYWSDLPQVSSETNLELDRPLVAEELLAALQSMEGGKAGGTL